MDVISIISDGFNIYFPIVMIIISTATYFNVGSRLLSLIGFPQYFADDEITEDIVTEGQRLAIAGIYDIPLTYLVKNFIFQTSKRFILFTFRSTHRKR